jgi:3-oxoacyl-[acyl-carrier-protein] synthase III
MSTGSSANIGIAAIATYQPPWILGNDWFQETIPRKFVHHTGIHSRPISEEDEVAMALRAAKALQRDIHCDWRNCAGLIFVSPSFIPLDIARQYLDQKQVRAERLNRAARRFAHRMKLPECPRLAINWFCSGYARALAIAQRRLAPAVKLEPHQFILVINSNRISRITDFGCMQTGGLFGDMATATLLARDDSPHYPAHFKLLYANAQKQPADGAFFNFHMREHVLVPQRDGSRDYDERRLVFSLNGMGVADAAPRAMSAGIVKALAATHISPADIRFVVPHQAGTGIVRLATMKIEALGITGEVINGLTSEVGNVSSCSIPYALKQHWSRLDGVIACPTAAVGRPGMLEMSQGCVILQATPLHSKLASAA